MYDLHNFVYLILSSPIDIPNFGGQHRSGRFPLTPPDSDGPDSPDADQGKRTYLNILKNFPDCTLIL